MLVIMILVIAIGTGFRQHEQNADEPGHWTQERDVDQVLSCASWQTSGDLIELAEDQIEVPFRCQCFSDKNTGCKFPQPVFHSHL